MSVIRPKLPEDPLRYAPVAGESAWPARERLADRLHAAREEVLGAAAAVATARAVLGLPDRLLADYGTVRPQSELFAILREARRLREAVDRVVVVGGAGVVAAQAIVEACCHPFHNELGRGDRGGRPRLSFAADDLDNDVAQGLLDLVAPHGGPRGDDLLDRWALVVVEGPADGGGTAAHVFLKALRDAGGGDERLLAERVVTIAAVPGRPAVAVPDGGREAFAIPAGLGDASAALSAAGLLPASIAGCDVVRLLEGAAAMNRRFREAPAADNPVLQFAADAWGVAPGSAGPAARRLTSRGRQLAGLAAWFDRLGRASGFRGSVLPVRLVVGECRRDRLGLPTPAVAGPDRVGRPTAEILLPRLDEHAIGQLLQMLMLAAAIEDRLGEP